MPMPTPEAQREYQREWLARRRAEFFKDKACVQCGSIKNLELDHIDPATKIHHAIWSWTKERREAEIAKCQVLCQPCHLKKSKQETTTTQHGTYAMRNHQGCTCEECLEYVRHSKEAWRDKQRVMA